MNIHSAIKFGAKNNIKVSPSHETSAPSEPSKTAEQKTQQNPNLNSSQSSNPSLSSNQNPSQNQNTENPAFAKSTTSTPALKASDSTLDNIGNTTPKALTKPADKADKPSFKAVDLSIAGSSHRITCPVDEVAQLEQAGAYINDKIRELRRAVKGKNPSNEELLVLTCLELYDQCQTLKNDRKNQLLDSERAKALIEKITKDARSVL
ncbi:cell division protein ZapA [Moraxella bovis]|uniref:cell division protein ZapA n=1 Tax=Moraxella bovis TaxID=476 RepID=UPI002227B32F|nr:cell division protein ZapA [Moraxella bovis]UYZ68265.1 cell division protein ZapA [Moraxella bovis]UYZ70638.1 cell division protein ZapA [Moraxella bovis]UYZ73428.1 cell division protein ZapA [Moraxella bovis]UYZ89776.1 cell division protein ZapA [Moraxella bovis]UYZ95128.1 cell division protein ZapA [Moraxella bovis]